MSEPWYVEECAKNLEAIKAGGEPGRARSNTAWSVEAVSNAMSCHPSQVQEFNQKAARGVRYEKDGTCYVASRGARAREMRNRGMYDKDGGYSD